MQSYSTQFLTYISDHLYHALSFLTGIVFGLIIRGIFIKKTKRKTKNSPIEFANFMEGVSKDNTKVTQYPNRSPKTKVSIPDLPIIENVEMIQEEKSEPIDLDLEPHRSKKVSIDESVEIKYFPNPNQEGNFRDLDARNIFLEGASLYKFSLMSATEASFEFCDNSSSVNMALNNRAELILAVADESNLYSPAASKIVCIEKDKGKAVLEGSTWRVTQKAKIQYI